MSGPARVIVAALLFALVPALARADDSGESVGVVAIAEIRFVDGVPPGRSVADRLNEIRRRIQAALAYPPLARLHRVEGVALLHFEVGRDGTAQALEVAASSGVPSLDRAALHAVRSAAPLPWVYGRLAVPVRFALDDGR